MATHIHLTNAAPNKHASSPDVADFALSWFYFLLPVLIKTAKT